ncbi:hypothetical protein CLV78_110122 [Aliiruegeria haliotis]|uniref:Uncharacterized protein n=1 Tax=Aliiruegeria haliotis TaxID=1280846 RepID=A0A2T0RJF6_9RHOB|nr:hypothetical protein CLV78_110122 [Aliiruegeria haliotis]
MGRQAQLSHDLDRHEHAILKSFTNLVRKWSRPDLV